MQVALNQFQCERTNPVSNRWEIITSVSQATLGPLKPSGTWMILCGTHRGVQVGALVVTAVGHGSLPHCTRKCEMTLKCGGARVE